MLTARRAVVYAASLGALSLPVAAWLLAGLPTGAAKVAVAAPAEAALVAPAIVRLDPTGYMREAHQAFLANVRQYSATFHKQELLEAGLTPVQKIELRIRHAPATVYMVWKENADQVRRALYVDDAKHRDKKGRKLARVEPNGDVARLFVKDIMWPIEGPEARKSSRRRIDECGFGPLFDLLEKINALAGSRGELDFRHEGSGQIGGRPTEVFVRLLPARAGDSDYPDAKMVLHMDRELRLPVAVYSYADREGRELLGSYVYTNVVVNPVLGDDAFRF